MKNENRYRGYSIFLIQLKPRRKYMVVSYAKDFKNKITKSLPEAKKFIDNILGV